MNRRRPLPASDSWVAWDYKIASGSLEPGIYKFTIRLKGRTPNQVLVSTLRSLFTVQLQTAGYEGVSVSNFLPVPDAATEAGTWPVIVMFTVPATLPPRKKGLDPRGLLKVAVNIIVATLNAVIVGTNLVLDRALGTVEHVVDRTLDTVEDTTSKVFNPTWLILIVFALFLVFLALPNLKR